MKTQYELEAPWQLMESVPMGTAVNVMHSDGTYGFATYHSRWDYASIAWCPIVPPKVKRWRADVGWDFYYVSGSGRVVGTIDNGDNFSNALHESGNYYRTREEAEAAAVRVKKAHQGGE